MKIKNFGCLLSNQRNMWFNAMIREVPHLPLNAQALHGRL